MRVTVFGATGKIGQLVVATLLDRGHDVVAYVRSPDKFRSSEPNLEIVKGTLSDADGIRRAVHGSQAVISALGPSLDRRVKGAPVADGTVNIIAAMKAEGVRRFIGMATPSVPDRRDTPTVRAKVLPLMARIAFPNALTELIGMTQAVTNSDLDWTLARITNPTDKPSKGTVRAGYLGRDTVGSSMSRVDIAAFLVDQLADDQFIRSAPAISN